MGMNDSAPESRNGGDLTDMTESMHGSMDLGGDVDKLRDFYDGWAADYDADVEENYGMPAMVAETLRRAIATRPELSAIAEPTAHIVDAGCGTGAVGAELHRAGWRNLHGIDLSPEMLKRAEARQIYQTLRGEVDLTARVEHGLARSADAVTAGGVFTVGHVPPEALMVMASIVRLGGLLVISVRDAYLSETDFVAVQQRLVDRGQLEPLVRIERAPYTMDSTGDYWAWRVAG